MKSKTPWQRFRHYLIRQFPGTLQRYRFYQTGRLAKKPPKSSYSQHGEDVILSGMFAEYDLTHGIYVDVGANHPIKLSNTYLLYLQGHHGILIEPNRSLLSLSEKFRKRDIPLGIGCGEVSSIKKFHISRNHVLSSFAPNSSETDPENFDYLPVFTLDAVHQSFREDYKFIFFLSIDVEGYDYEVLMGSEEMLSKTLFLCIEANDAESEEKIKGFLKRFQFTLVQKVKVNMIFKNTNAFFDQFLKNKLP